MSERQRSAWRTVAGLASAILVAPLAAALCFSAAMILAKGPAGSLSDTIGGTLTVLVFALVFGGVLAIVPVLALGSVAITLARLLGTRSSLFFAAAGSLAGACMALLDAARMGSGFAWPEAIPFVIGGCASALAYWAVVER